MNATTPTFLSVEQVRELHDIGIAEFGGSPGLRDGPLLEGAVASPRATYGGKPLYEDLADMAAAYLYHIVKDHPFVDGNKRAGSLATVVFLDLNGFEFDADSNKYESLVLKVAACTFKRSAVAKFLRRHLKPATR